MSSIFNFFHFLHNITISQYYNITILQYHNITISHYYNITISPYYHITISQYQNITILQYHNITILKYHIVNSTRQLITFCLNYFDQVGHKHKYTQKDRANIVFALLLLSRGEVKMVLELLIWWGE